MFALTPRSQTLTNAPCGALAFTQPKVEGEVLRFLGVILNAEKLSPRYIATKQNLHALMRSINVGHSALRSEFGFASPTISSRPTAHRTHRLLPLHTPITCDGFFTLGSWLSVSIRSRLSSLAQIFDLGIRICSMRNSLLPAGTAHHPAIGNNVTADLIFNFQDTF